MDTSYSRRTRWSKSGLYVWCLLILACTALSVSGQEAQEKPSPDSVELQKKIQQENLRNKSRDPENTVELSPGRVIERDLKGMERHVYKISVKADQYLHIVVNQRGIDVRLRLGSTEDAELATVDTPNGTYGPESLSLITKAEGVIFLSVSPADYASSPAHYDISLIALRAPNSADKLRIEAQKVLKDAKPPYWSTKPEDYKKALKKYDQALRLWEKIGDPYGQGFTLSAIANLRAALGDNAASFEAHTRALSSYRLAGDPAGEYRALSGIGSYYFAIKDNQQALTYFNLALSIAAQLGEKLMRIHTLQDAALSEWNLGQQRLAIDHFQQTLAMARELVETPYEKVFPSDRAIEFLNQAVRVRQMDKDAAGEASIYLDLGWVSSFSTYDCRPSLAFYQKAFAATQTDSNQATRQALLEKLEPAFVATGKQCGGYRSQQAVEAYLSLLQILETKQNQKEIANTLETLGNAYLQDRQPAKGIERLEKALAIWKSTGDLKREADALDRLGDVHESHYKNEKALAFWKEATTAKRRINDSEGQIEILFKRAKLYSAWSKHNDAANAYEELLTIKSERSGKIQIVSLINLGREYLELSRTDDAISRLESAVLQARTGNQGDRIILAIALNNLGELYRLTGKVEKAIDSYLTAIREGGRNGSSWFNDPPELILGSGYDSIQRYLHPQEISEDIEIVKELALDPQSRRGLNAGVIFNNLGLAFYSIGKYELAKKEYERALVDQEGRKSSLVNEVVANNLGLLYKTLAQYDKALFYYEQNLAQLQRSNNRAGVAIALNNLGGLYEARGDHKRAITTFKRALDSMREVKDRKGEGTVVNNLGSVYLSLKRDKDALEHFNQALTIRRQIKDRLGEADTLSNLGSTHLLLKDYKTATKFYQEALIIERESGDRLGQATAFHNLMLGARSVDNSMLAIFYGKQAVNTLQQLRANTSGIGKDAQSSFLRSREETYRTLADLLVAAGRIPEAELVLEMLKEEEFSQYVRRDAREIEKLSKRVDLREDERAALERYSLLADKLTALGVEVTNLEYQKNSLPAGASFAEQARYDELVQQLADANKAFRLFLEKDLVAEVGKGAKKEIEVDRALQGKLEQWGVGTVALYTIVGEDRYRVILTTSKTQSDGKTEIKAADLNQKIFAFREALQDPRLDPRPLGKELYDILVKPVENDLKGAQAQTLIWSLDGTLRYIPLAALWDGEQYMAQKYRIVVVTSTTRQSLSEPVEPNRIVLGLGVTKESKVLEPFGTTPVSFDALPGVDKELQAIVNSEDAKQQESGVLKGKRLVDGEFTALEMKNRLGLREENKRKYNIIHFATHFRLGGNTATSFLLLGNNQAMTLEQVSDSPQMNFTDVELVTLSACNTGYGSLAARKIEEKEKQQFLKNNGKEVDSLAAFIEARGAKAVLATLWPVADESTQLLMTDFYRLGKNNPNMSKAEALRQAQLSQLSGDVQQTESEKNSQRAELAVPTQPSDSSALPLFKPDPKAPYAHPYYWAPFILIGNWR